MQGPPPGDNFPRMNQLHSQEASGGLMPPSEAEIRLIMLVGFSRRRLAFGWVYC